MKKNNRFQRPKIRTISFLIIFLMLVLFMIPTLVTVSNEAKKLFASLSFSSDSSSIEKKSSIPAKLRWFDPFGDINK